MRAQLLIFFHAHRNLAVTTPLHTRLCIRAVSGIGYSNKIILKVSNFVQCGAQWRMAAHFHEFLLNQRNREIYTRAFIVQPNPQNLA